MTAGTLAAGIAPAVAVRAQEGTREGEGGRGLADAPGAVEQVSVGEPSSGEQRAHDAERAILADDGGEAMVGVAGQLDLRGGLLLGHAEGSTGARPSGSRQCVPCALRSAGSSP